MATEVWKDIKGYEGYYQVSSYGNVRSVKRKIGTRMFKGRILRQKQSGCNEKYDEVSLCRNGKSEHRTVHKLVAETFIPNPNDLPEVNHKDKNTHNNRIENLKWCDRKYSLLAWRSGKEI